MYMPFEPLSYFFIKIAVNDIIGRGKVYFWINSSCMICSKISYWYHQNQVDIIFCKYNIIHDIIYYVMWGDICIYMILLPAN